MDRKHYKNNHSNCERVLSSYWISKQIFHLDSNQVPEKIICNDKRIVTANIKRTLEINKIVKENFIYPGYEDIVNLKLQIDEIKELELTEDRLGENLYNVEKISAVFKITDSDCKSVDVYISKDMRDMVIKNLKFNLNNNSLVLKNINLIEILFMDPGHNEKFLLDIINRYLSKTVGDFRAMSIEYALVEDDGVLLVTIFRFKEYETEVSICLKIDFKYGVFNINILKDNNLKPIDEISKIFLEAIMKD